MVTIELKESEFSILDNLECLNIHSLISNSVIRSENRVTRSLRNPYILIENGKHIQPFNRIKLSYPKEDTEDQKAYVMFYVHYGKLPVAMYQLSQPQLTQILREVSIREIDS